MRKRLRNIAFAGMLTAALFGGKAKIAKAAQHKPTLREHTLKQTDKNWTPLVFRQLIESAKDWKINFPSLFALIETESTSRIDITNGLIHKKVKQITGKQKPNLEDLLKVLQNKEVNMETKFICASNTAIGSFQLKPIAIYDYYLDKDKRLQKLTKEFMKLEKKGSYKERLKRADIKAKEVIRRDSKAKAINVMQKFLELKKKGGFEFQKFNAIILNEIGMYQWNKTQKNVLRKYPQLNKISGIEINGRKVDKKKIIDIFTYFGYHDGISGMGTTLQRSYGKSNFNQNEVKKILEILTKKLDYIKRFFNKQNETLNIDYEWVKLQMEALKGAQNGDT